MIEIYTDGSSRGNPGPAGWGCVIFYNDKVTELGGSSKHATNNQMELTAVSNAFSFCIENKIKDEEIIIFSDSKGQCVQAINEWIYNWEKRDWKGSNRKPIKNTDLYKEILQKKRDVINLKNNVLFKYVEAHVGIHSNERADDIAYAFASGESPNLPNLKTSFSQLSIKTRFI